MSTEDLQKKRGWLNKSEMAASLGISPQAFDKWGVEPADSTPFGHSAHADPDTCSTLIRTG
ncbi:hypothetical protein ACT028_20865, partial [Pseudomonas aeruginosa]